MPPVARVSAAMAGLIWDFKALQADLQEKLHKQEERLTMLDHKSAVAARPALSTHAEVDAPHQKAFDAYLRSGEDDGLRGLELEGKAMSSEVNSDGGYLVDPVTAESIKSTLASTASIRAISNVVNFEATSFDVLIDQNDTGAGWADEVSASAETGTPTIERISIPLYELNAMPKISQRLLDDSAFNVEEWLAGRISDKFARAEASAFVSGDGIDKPPGFLNHTAADRYRKRFRKAHAQWGNGTLMSAAMMRPLAREPRLDDRDYLECQFLVFEALFKRRQSPVS